MDIHKKLINEVERAYLTHAKMLDFAPFPDDLSNHAVEPHHRPVSTLLQNETGLKSTGYAELQTALIAASEKMYWRDIYKSPPKNLSSDAIKFMDKLGCYAIIGDNAPFHSQKLRLFMVYMPAGLYYPWHTHPAEEIYLVISGSAIFKRGGHPDRNIAEGETMFHETNQPHAIQTTDTPLLSLVVWRNHLTTPPILLDMDLT